MNQESARKTDVSLNYKYDRCPYLTLLVCRAKPKTELPITRLKLAVAYHLSRLHKNCPGLKLGDALLSQAQSGSEIESANQGNLASTSGVIASLMLVQIPNKCLSFSVRLTRYPREI